MLTILLMQCRYCKKGKLVWGCWEGSWRLFGTDLRAFSYHLHGTALGRLATNVGQNGLTHSQVLPWETEAAISFLTWFCAWTNAMLTQDLLRWHKVRITSYHCIVSSLYFVELWIPDIATKRQLNTENQPQPQGKEPEPEPILLARGHILKLNDIMLNHCQKLTNLKSTCQTIHYIYAVQALARKWGGLEGTQASASQYGWYFLPSIHQPWSQSCR